MTVMDHDARTADTGPLRHLDEHGEAVPESLPPDSPWLAPDFLLSAYRAMVAGRAFDEQASALAMQGGLAVYPSSRGQEACQIGAVLALRPDDWLLPTYRDTVALVSRGIDPVDALTLLRGTWHCGYDPVATRTMPQCTPLATHLPHAVGLAMAARRRGEDTVALALVGEGATSEGDFHEACNLAAVFEAPVVFLVQNNGYAISVPLSRQTHAAALADRAAGYGMPGVQVDGNDVLAVTHAVADAAARARAGGGPTLIEALTYRVAAHTNADDDSRYRAGPEIEMWRGRDPLARLDTYLRARGLLDDAAAAEIARAAEAANADLRSRFAEAPSDDPDDLQAHVYAPPPPPRPYGPPAARPAPATRGARDRPEGAPSIGATAPSAGAATPPAAQTLTMARALNAALRDALAEDDRVVVFGEDVGRLGGVFRVTDGLTRDFGERRCFDTPIAEAGILGVAIGMAARGLRPVVEMQFDAFGYPAFEQIAGHLAKMRNRTRGALPLPIVVRVPYGGGIGGVEHHSDSSEGYAAHTPGLRVFTPATVADAYGMLRAAIDSDDPVIFFEPKRLYWTKAEIEFPLTPEPIGRAVVRRSGTDATIITYGPCVPVALRAAEAAVADGYDLEVIDLRTLTPLDEQTVYESVRRTGRAVVLHESSGFAGVGAEIAARVTDNCFYHLSAPVRRVAGLDIPYPPPILEHHYLPSVDAILDVVAGLEWEDR